MWLYILFYFKVDVIAFDDKDKYGKIETLNIKLGEPK